MHGSGPRAGLIQPCRPSTAKTVRCILHSSIREDREMTLENKVGWVTGGASGLGEATVRRLAEEGAAVVVADVDKERGDQLTTELQEKGQRVAFVEANVTDPNDVDGL